MDTTGRPGEMSPRCAEHPTAPVAARCVVCGKFLCSMCRFMYGNKNYCRPCAQMAGVPGAAPSDASGVGAGQWGSQPGAAPGPLPYGGGPPPPPGWGYGPPQGSQPYYYPYPPQYYRPAREVVFEGAPWGVGEAVIIFLLSIAIGTGLALLMRNYFVNNYSDVPAVILTLFFSSVVLYTLLLGGTFFSVMVRHHSHPSALGLRLSGMGKGTLWGVAVGLPLFVAAIMVSFIADQLLGPNKNPDMVSQAATKVGSGGISIGLFLLLAIALVILAPVCEEIFFRGYLYPALRNRVDRTPALIINGVMFAAAHFEIIGFLPRALLGIGLSYVYERNRTLWAPIAGHAVYNGMILLITVLLSM